MDPQADRGEPRRGRVIGASQRETKENTMQRFIRTVRAVAWTTPAPIGAPWRAPFQRDFTVTL